MKKFTETLKSIKTRSLDLLVGLLILLVGLITIFINGAFISNIINSLRLTGHIDPSIGIQIVLVVLSLVWIPICIINANKR